VSAKYSSVLWVALGLILALPALSQTVSTVAGDSTWGTVDRVTLDGAGNIYVADFSRDVIYKVDHLGNATIIAGVPGKGLESSPGDGGLATNAAVYAPDGITVTPDGGTIYIAETGPNPQQSHQRIRKVAPDGIITTIAGTGSRGFSGDGGPASSAKVDWPWDIHMDATGALYFVDAGNYRIRRIGTDGVITTVAGSGKSGMAPDGNPATSTDMEPRILTLASDGTVYFSDLASNTVRVRKFTLNGTVTTVAGIGAAGFSGDGGPATAAKLEGVTGLVLDGGGNLYISGGDRIRRVAPNGIITTYAGTGTAGYSGDGGDAINAKFHAPAGLAVDSKGVLYVADSGNDKIRKIVPPTPPTISFTNAAIPVWSGGTGFTSNSFVTIYGSNLSTVTEDWSQSFNAGQAPTSLGGVSVTVNNIPAYIQYVSPSQVNINTPDDTATGLVDIVVKNQFGSSNTGTAMRAQVSPTFLSVANFSAGSKVYVVAQTPDFQKYIGPTNLIQGVSFTAAKPGDTVIIYAVGCGPTNPATHAGVLAAQNSPLALPYEVKVGGVEADVSFAGILGGTVGLYQFNVVIPNVPAGDQPIELIVNGVANAQNLLTTVGQ
jgi:uncharacterized protein (TIGR03437 family)